MPKNSKIIVQKKCYQKGNYYLEETIGEGAFAKVKLAVHIPTGEKVAIKILNKEHLFEDESESNDINKIRKEINILKRIRHKNIIQLYEIMESKSNLYIVMEYCENKELFDYIVYKKYLKEKEACRLFQQIIDGVEYLHLSNITHRDLKPENLLLDKNNRIKISDFGLSFLADNINTLLETPCGTPSYAPPEMLRGEKYNGVFSDIWSCGIILYTMLVGNLPCAESKEELIYENILKHNYYFPEYISSEAIDLIENMLKINPKERFNFEQIKSHPWFNLVKPKLKPGIVYGVHKIPIDSNILNIIERKYGYDKEKCLKSISNYNFDENCSIYYLTLKQIIKEKKESISDLFSDEYIKYLRNYQNWIKIDEINNPLFINYQAQMPLKINNEKEIEKEKENICNNNLVINDNIKNKNNQIKSNNKKNSDKTITTSRLEKNFKNKKIRKNSSYGDISNNILKNEKIKEIIKKRVMDKKESEKHKNENLIKKKFGSLTKRNKNSHLNKIEFNLNKNQIQKYNFINKSAQNRKKKNISLDLIENDSIKTKNINKIKKTVQYSKIIRRQNNIKPKVRNRNAIVKKDLSNKLIDISNIESQKDEIVASESISFNSRIILSPRAFSSLSNDNNSNNFSEISKRKESSYIKPKNLSNKKLNQKKDINIILLDNLKQNEKIKLKNKLFQDEKKFNHDLNVIDNITNDTTIVSNVNENNNDLNTNRNINMVHLMAKRMIKNSIFGKYLLKNKKTKKIIKADLENKFYTLQKYKDIIGLIEKIKNKIFKKKYIDFNYEVFDEYLNDDDDKIFSQSLLNLTGINRFIKNAKTSLYQTEKQKKRAYSKVNNLYSYKFKKEVIQKNYAKTQNNFGKFMPKRNLGYYKLKRNLNLSYLTSDENNINFKNNLLRKNHKKNESNNSIASYNESIINSMNSINDNTNSKNCCSSENIKKNQLNINLKKNKNQSQSTNKLIECNSDINNNIIINMSNKNKISMNNSSFIIKDINENEKSFSSNENTNNNISDKNISIIKNEPSRENDIYKKNKNIITPQLGSKINNISNNIYTQNTPNKYDIDEREKFIIDNIPLMVNIKSENDNNENKSVDIAIKDNKKLKEEVWKLSDKKSKKEIKKEINDEKIYRNEITFLNNNENTNKSNITFSENKNKKLAKSKINFPIDLNCLINLSLSEIKSRIKSYFKKFGFFYNEKDNTIKIKKVNTSIEIQICKLDEEKNLFYLKIKLKSNEMKKSKEKIMKLLTILNHNKN